jgi:hypothetical protein
VSNADTVRERVSLQRYLNAVESADGESATEVDATTVKDALEKLAHHPEPEAGFMLSRGNIVPRL